MADVEYAMISSTYTTLNDKKSPPPFSPKDWHQIEKHRIFDSGTWINTFLNSNFNDFKCSGPDSQLPTC